MAIDEYKGIAEALAGAKSQMVKENPWYYLSKPFADLNTDSMSGDAGGWGLAAAIAKGLGGGVSSAAERASTQDFNEKYKSLAEALSGGNQEELDKNPLFEAIKPEYLMQKTRKEAERQAEIQKLKDKMKFEDLMTIGDDGSVSMVPGALDILGKRKAVEAGAAERAQQQAILDFAGRIEEAKGRGKAATLPPEENNIPTPEEADPLGLGMETLAIRTNKLARKIRAETGATPNAALEQAAKQLEGERKLAAEDNEKINNSAAKAAQMRSLADRGESYVDQAGITGGEGMMPQWLRDLAARGVQPEKFEASKNLDTLKQEFMRLSYIKGSAGLNGPEAQALLQSGISSDNLKGTNKEIARKLRIEADREENTGKVHSAILDAYGTMNGKARALLDQYQKENPVFKREGNKIVYNEKIVPAEKWLQSRLSRGKVVTAPDGNEYRIK